MKHEHVFYNCTTAGLSWYVGIFASGRRDIFQLDHNPTDDGSFPYVSIVGPFKNSETARRKT